ncbi:MAG: rod shape-determining protein RodA [Bacteroidales bacterium]|nr:rod shape-determining protein RodA [Bacteroidales bacterium]
MKRRINTWSEIDWITIILYLLIVVLGWVSIYSAGYNEEHNKIFDLSQRYGKQMILICGALIIALLVVVTDSRFYSLFAYIIYAIVILLLIVVLLIGKEIHGAKSWFEFGFFRLQPAEFAKIGTAMALARYVSSKSFNIKNSNNVFNAVVIILIPAVLIYFQPDTGSALVYFALILVLYREGLPGGILLIGILMMVLFVLTLMINKMAIIIALMVVGFMIFLIIDRKIKRFLIAVLIYIGLSGTLFGLKKFAGLGLSVYFILILSLIISGFIYSFFIYFYRIRKAVLIYMLMLGSIIFTFSVDYAFNNVLKPHQQKRINILFGIDSDPYGSGYNVNQSIIAIGSGGFSGKGFLKGTQTKFEFVPEQSTDFIFCTVGEEWGFRGTSLIIILFTTLLLRILFLAERQRNGFCRIFGYSVFVILLFHFVVNIGMTIGLLPVIGIPLPFMSYGGSSLWAFTILLFIFLRLDISRLEYLV